MYFLFVLIFVSGSCYAIKSLEVPVIAGVTYRISQLPAALGNGKLITEGECGNIAFQHAPIHIDTTKTIDQVFEKPLTLNGWTHAPSSATVSNNFGRIYVEFTFPNDTPTITGGPLGETTYKFKGLRVKFGLTDNAGTEHALNEEKFALECQMHFVSPKGENSFIVVMFASSPTGLGMDTSVFEKIKHHGSSHAFLPLTVPLSLDKIVQPGGLLYATYVGTDTEPPCTPKARWFISLKQQLIDEENVAACRTIMGENGIVAAPNFRKLQGSSTGGILVGLTAKGD